MVYVMKKDANKIDSSKVGRFDVVDIVRRIVIGNQEIDLYGIDRSYTERLDLFGGAECEYSTNK